MMRETASAKATAPPKQVIHEAPVKFRSGKHTAIVKEVFDIAPQFPPTYLIRFTFENESVFDFEPGQFISIFAEKDGKRISRPYSIASWPENKAYLELCIKVVEGGFMSNYLHHVRPGTKLPTIGPLGRFVMQEPIPYDTVFVATGTGVAPFIAMMGHIWEQGMDHGREFHMVFGVRYVHDLIYRDLIERDGPERTAVTARDAIVPCELDLGRAGPIGHTFHEKPVQRLRVPDDHEVPAFRRLEPVRPSVHEHIVPGLQRGPHALVFDPEAGEGEHSGRGHLNFGYTVCRSVG